MGNTPTQIITRFAPSPTGDLHIGSARTALFNWLLARRHGGKFLLRIEDTDFERSTPEATKSILSGLSWLGIDWDGEPISQRSLQTRHKQVVTQLLDSNKAYKCFSTKEEILENRESAKKSGNSTLFKSPWRNVGKSQHPNEPYSVRLKTPENEVLKINDKVQGEVSWNNNQLDDMILLRSDGTPTYMLAVVVDDHDMGVTHIIRGDDHLSNAGRQKLIYQALGWSVPIFAHIPLIHGEDGKKLSKRHGALDINSYAEMGYIPEGVINYLCRLGWSHGDDEIFTTSQAKSWFNLENIGKGPARLDLKKMEFVNKQHMSTVSYKLIEKYFDQYLINIKEKALSTSQKLLLNSSFGFLKNKIKTFSDLLEQIRFIRVDRPIDINDEKLNILVINNKNLLKDLTPLLQNVNWNRDELESLLLNFSSSHNIKFGELARPIRIILSGKSHTPSIIDMMTVLGREETLSRFDDFC
jgi:glutamyl-tRNA synthetase|tara:strand:- start:3603 stop:5009 length:1407 start_codon:yes stop_codon:yes gene_type:complete